MFHEDLQISFFRTLGSANIADVICVLVDPAINTYCILVRFFWWFSVTKNNSWLIMRDSASSFRSFCYTHSISQFGSSMIIKWDLFLNNKCFCAVRVNSSHVTWIQRIIRHSLYQIWLCIVHAIFLPSFLQEFESHDGGLSQDKWVFYFNDEAEKERFLKALSDIWIKFFQVQYMNLHTWRLGSDFIIT